MLRDLDDAGLCSEIWTNCSCKTYIHALICRYWCMYISTLGCPFNFAIFLLLTNYSFTLLLLSDLVLGDLHLFLVVIIHFTVAYCTIHFGFTHFNIHFVSSVFLIYYSFWFCVYVMSSVYILRLPKEYYDVI